MDAAEDVEMPMNEHDCTGIDDIEDVEPPSHDIEDVELSRDWCMDAIEDGEIPLDVTEVWRVDSDSDVEVIDSVVAIDDDADLAETLRLLDGLPEYPELTDSDYEIVNGLAQVDVAQQTGPAVTPTVPRAVLATLKSIVPVVKAPGVSHDPVQHACRVAPTPPFV